MEQNIAEKRTEHTSKNRCVAYEAKLQRTLYSGNLNMRTAPHEQKKS